MGVSGLGKFFDIQHGKRRVGDGFAKNGLGIGLERGVQLLFGTIWGNKGEVDPHLPHGDMEEVIGTAVNRGAGNHMVATVGNVENSIEISRLT